MFVSGTGRDSVSACVRENEYGNGNEEESERGEGVGWKRGKGGNFGSGRCGGNMEKNEKWSRLILQVSPFIFAVVLISPSIFFMNGPIDNNTSLKHLIRFFNFILSLSPLFFFIIFFNQTKIKFIIIPSVPERETHIFYFIKNIIKKFVKK